jgi:uncharacterized protein
MPPIASEWIETLDEAIAACQESPIVVAHSLGCIMIAHWAGQRSRPVKAAMLVAPPDGRVGHACDSGSTCFPAGTNAPTPFSQLSQAQTTHDATSTALF